jgi:SAM-dependent methyltransferase
LPYQKKGAFIIGLESSLPSIRANPDVDLRVFGSATKIPFADQSVDMVVCFYSVHHFVGNNLDETYDLVIRAFREFERVIKPGGFLFIFEMSPMKPDAMVQKAMWNSVRKVLGKKLDMHFPDRELFRHRAPGYFAERRHGESLFSKQLYRDHTSSLFLT